MLDYVKDLVPRVHQVKQVVIILAGAIDPNHQAEAGKLLTHDEQEEYIWHSGDPSVDDKCSRKQSLGISWWPETRGHSYSKISVWVISTI